MIKKYQILILFFLFTQTLWAASPCIINELDDVVNDVVPRGDKNPKSQALVEDMLEFAKEHNLPYRVVEFGPEERRVKRLIVGMDQTDTELREIYRKRYQHTVPLKGSDEVQGVIPIEIQREDMVNPEHYVTGIPRIGHKNEDMTWRWGHTDNLNPSTYGKWWDGWINGNHGTPGGDRFPGHQAGNHITSYSHLIPMNKAERENFEFFLDNKDLRAPCKTDNCIAWVTNIELGKTAKDATAAERRHLFPELGVSRSVAHFEIGRRLMHAADDNHAGMMMFYRGEEGRKAFDNEMEKFFPPEPKIPYSSILLTKIPDDAPVMQALDVIEDGDKIYFPIASGASPEAMTALAQKAENFENGVTAQMSISGLSESVIKRSQKEKNPKLKIESLFIGGNQREVNHAGKVNLIHGYLSDFAKRIKDPEDKVFKYDAIVVRVNPKKVNGAYSLGATSGNILDIIKNNPDIKIIAEFNENVPLTVGENTIPANRITRSFESDSQLASSPVVPLTEVETEIGKHLGSLVDTGATLQLGIGNIFDGLPKGILENRRARDLKISTEMFGDPLAEVVKSGRVVEAQTGFAFGTSNLYRWLDKNKSVRVVPQSKVNDLTKVRETERFTAINTALQVDLRGNVNATMGPPVDGRFRRISSPGGQVDFMSSASLAKDGKAVIAIRSTAKGGDISTISLKTYGDEVTTRSEFVTHVVTEYGIADLAGKSEAEKALELISVAHPKFREGLLEEAKASGIVSEAQFNNVGSAKFRKDAPRFVSDYDQARPLEIANGQMNYKVHNPDAEETVVLIHGLGSNGRTWDDTVKDFTDQGYRVVTYDQRGHGKTFASGTDFSNQRMAKDLEDLLDYLEIKDPVTLVGHSMGGRTAMKFSANNPKRVRALIVEDMHAKRVYKGETDALYFTRLMEGVKRGRNTNPDGFYNFLKKNEGFYSESRLDEAMSEFIPDRLERRSIMETHLVQGNDGLYRLEDYADEISTNALYYRGGLMEDLTNDIKKIKAPTLFLGATDKSKVLFGKGAEHIAQNMPDAKIVTVPRSHHGIHESNPRGFMNEIIKFRQESELPKPMRTIPAEKTVLRMDPPRRIDITDINYVDTGIGKWGTILYIHDINKSVAESSKEIAALKRQGFRVIAPDLRGHGNTISQGNSYSPTVLANDLDVLLKDLEVTKFHTVAMGQGQKVARELKRMRGNEIGKSIYMERIPSMREIMPNPRTIQRVLEEMPQVYNSSDELFNELRKHFSMSVSQAIQKALEIKKPNGDIVVNRAIPVRWFIDHDFNSHKVLRTVANNPNDEVKLGPGSTTKDMIKVVDKFIPTAKGARSWLRFLSP